MNVAHLIAILLVGFLPPWIGAWLIWRGCWPPRVGKEPHCRYCGSVVTLPPAKRCPECGGGLSSRSIRFGRRRYRPGWALMGGLLVFTGIGYLVFSYAQGYWYQCRPNSWLMADLLSLSREESSQAWSELRLRASRGRLDDSDRRELIAWFTSEKGSVSFSQDVVDYLGQCYLDGLFTSQQTNAFFSRLITLQLQVRSRLPLGDHVPFLITARARLPREVHEGRNTGSFVLHVVPQSVQLDGQLVQPVENTVKRDRGWGTPNIWGMVRCDTPGTHMLTVQPSVEVHLSQGDSESSRLLHTQAFAELGSSFELLNAEPASYIQLSPSQRLGRDLKEVIQPGNPQVRNGKMQIPLTVRELPTDVAFDVLVRVGDREYQLDQIAMRRGVSVQLVLEGSYGGPVVGKAELILRASEELARQTVDLYDIWSWELIWPDLPIESGQP